MAQTPRAPSVKVELTEELIEQAVERHSGFCMWAEGVKAAYPDATSVAVDVQTIRFSDLKKGFRYTYLTPRSAAIALVNFDAGNRPAPFDFKLRKGQVSRAGRVGPKRKVSEKQREQRKKAGAKGRDNLAKATLKRRSRNSQEVPDRIGGKPPPQVPGQFSKRREFGLRAFER